MRRSLGDVTSSFPCHLRQGKGNEEKTAAKKLPPSEVLLIGGAVLRLSGSRRLPLLLPLSFFLLLLPLSHCSQAYTAQATSRVLPDSRRSAYRYIGGAMCTARTRRYDAKQQTLYGSFFIIKDLFHAQYMISLE
ncbi:hypothetical protein BHM03_00026393 [Ensete ventricosum]|nr:hypothetical protein BHM03_00026393 [Ensete ventricosum]